MNKLLLFSLAAAYLMAALFCNEVNAEGVDNVTLVTSSSQDDFPIQQIMLDNVSLTVKIADTQARMEQGLQFSNPLPYDEGMIFTPPHPQVLSMWMPNMKFSLDIIWFDGDGNVQHVEKNIPPCTSLEQSTCPIYYENGSPSQYALEVTSGFIDKYHITMNSKLAVPIPEFGTIVEEIAAISLIGVLLICRKSNLCFFK